MDPSGYSQETASNWDPADEIQRSEPQSPLLDFNLHRAAGGSVCQTVPEAGVKTWDDVNRIDVRPSKGMLKLWCMNNWEVQIDVETAKVLQVAYRRSDLIEAIHDGSWFHDLAKYWLFLPTGVCLLALWATGLYLFVLPYWVKWRRPKRVV